ncbi:hypothetical protein [Jeotgalibacillus aurantiacus]|uniref:hypothetical protein n=1 Tax=Jeotgalibacillus aurantiacus TaxID=2763266 RepID=UPI001D0B3027|nr:hypothetical protein [Jeotgalibacillus aurantiacus]
MSKGDRAGKKEHPLRPPRYGLPTKVLPDSVELSYNNIFPRASVLVGLLVVFNVFHLFDKFQEMFFWIGRRMGMVMNEKSFLKFSQEAFFSLRLSIRQR